MTLVPFPLSFACRSLHIALSADACCVVCCVVQSGVQPLAARLLPTQPRPPPPQTLRLLLRRLQISITNTALLKPLFPTPRKTPNWRGRSQRRANTTIPNPTSAIGRWKTATKRMTISFPVSALHHAPDLARPRVNARADRDRNHLLQRALMPKRRSRRSVRIMMCDSVSMGSTHT